MKYWEIVKNLTENPTLSGVAVIGSIRYELYVDDSRTLQSATYYLQLGTKGTSIGEAGNIDFDGWEIVRQPVTWQEAIEVWAKGKTVTVSTPFGFESKEVEKSHGSSITEYEITKGTWYVED